MIETQTPKIITEPAEKYNSLRATHLTSHGLMDYMRCPKTHKLKTSGDIPFKTSKSYEIGTAAHVLILEGREAFDARYFVIDPAQEPVNDKTGKPYGPTAKAYTEWLDSAKGERIALSATEGAMIEAMAESVRLHNRAAALLEEGHAEGTLRTVMQGVKVQTRMDWFNPDAGIVDIKTISDLDKFIEQFVDYQYDIQAAFYQMVAEDVFGCAFPVHMIVVEKQAPYRVGVFEVHTTRMETKRREIVRMIDAYAESVASDHWPTRYESVRVIGGGE